MIDIEILDDNFCLVEEDNFDELRDCMKAQAEQIRKEIMRYNGSEDFSVNDFLNERDCLEDLGVVAVIEDKDKTYYLVEN